MWAGDDTVQSMEQANKELEALLDFYLASGIDCVLEEDAVDRFLETAQWIERQAVRPEARGGNSQPRPAFTQAIQPQAPSQFAAPIKPASISQGDVSSVVLPDALAVQSARDAAHEARTLDELRVCLERFEGCNLRLTAKNLVFADGNPEARVMFVGEAPGRDEDLQGRPFVGRSGQLLDRMLKAIGLDRSSAYIANVVPWRPPGNRTPTPQETEICKPFIQRQIELVSPEILVFLGAASAKTLLGTTEGIRKLRGRWMPFVVGETTIQCIATYHPAYLLRSPLEKRLSWRDFLSIREKLTSQGLTCS